MDKELAQVRAELTGLVARLRVEVAATARINVSLLQLLRTLQAQVQEPCRPLH